MYWEEIKRSEHFEKHHKRTLAWSDIVNLIYSIKNKRKKGNKIEIEDNKFYMSKTTSHRLVECSGSVI